MEPTCPGQEFVVEEVCAAARLSRTAIENLIRQDIAPASVGGGRGSPRRFPTSGLAQLCLIGALFHAGAELMPSARLAKAVSTELIEIYGYLPDALDGFARDRYAPIADLPTGVADRFILFEAIADRRPEAPLVTARPEDLTLAIVDRRFAFLGRAHPLPVLSPWSGRTGEMQPAFEIDGWERGSSEFEIWPVIEHFETGDAPAGRDTEDRFQAARSAAVGVIMVNVSLAVRRGFATVRDLRGEPPPRGLA
jgi:hypothetical protein